MSNSFSLEQKIHAVESAIEEFRWARAETDLPEHGIWLILKAVAAELRLDLPQTADEAFNALEFQISSAQRAKANGQFSNGHQKALAEAVLAHWDAIHRRLRTVRSVP
jgi:hypothetical protein